MSYAGAGRLQAAIYQALVGDAELTAAVDGRVYDATPHAERPDAASGPYVLIGEERARRWGAQGLDGAEHDVDVVVVTREPSFSTAKTAAAAASAAVLDRLPELPEGRVAVSEFLGARTRIARGGVRRIELRFRFKLEL